MACQTAGVKLRQWRMCAAVLTCLVVCACSSSGAPVASSPARATNPARSALPSPGPVQNYLGAVNALCDALLSKIVKVTNGGSFDIPLEKFLQQLPEHTMLEHGFDADVAKIPVPAAAKDKAAALSAYVRFADDLDARRLAAAKRGEAAYKKEIAAEADAANDPRVTALSVAGFNKSCDAR
jgi:hypothetical protein